jgi:hypothetical protein
MMRKRLVLALAFCAAAMGMSAAATSLFAAPLSRAALSLSYAGSSSFTKAQYGCGWEYACPPRPWFGRRSRAEPQVYIENNYGTVNIYQGGRRHYRRPAYDPWRWRERDGEDRRDYRPCYGDSCGYRRCDGDTCGESCGIVCWYRRVRNGYCGHGCEAYREQARDERYYDEYDDPRPYGYSPRPRYEDEPPARFERPSKDERIPLRRFYGPKYP